MRRTALLPLLLAAVLLAGARAERSLAGARAAVPTFSKTVLDREFRSEGVAVADVNRDGRKDILAGNLWYEAPRWVPREIRPVQRFDAAGGYSNSFINFAADVNRDGWPDQLLVGFPGQKAIWAENPRGGSGAWREHTIWRSACNESPLFADLLGNGRRVLVFPYDERQMAWYEPGPDAGAEFRCYPIGEPDAPGTKKFAHGLGVGDLNGDRRPDLMTTAGFWEAPADPRSGSWKFVRADLGPDCAQMHAYDVDGDGDADVVSSSAHRIGVWWHEQLPGPQGPEFRRHVIDDTFSQSHALEMADINRDGVMDFVTGKRFWAHGPNGDVRPGDPAVLYWFALRREAGKPVWTRHEIDTDSGVGTQFEVTDVNGDGLLDIAIANKKGVFYFEQRR